MVIVWVCYGVCFGLCYLNVCLFGLACSVLFVLCVLDCFHVFVQCVRVDVCLLGAVCVRVCEACV